MVAEGVGVGVGVGVTVTVVVSGVGLGASLVDGLAGLVLVEVGESESELDDELDDEDELEEELDDELEDDVSSGVRVGTVAVTDGSDAVGVRVGDGRLGVLPLHPLRTAAPLNDTAMSTTAMRGLVTSAALRTCGSGDAPLRRVQPTTPERASESPAGGESSSPNG